MKRYAGTSGFACREWKGGFYPSDLKHDGGEGPAIAQRLLAAAPLSRL